MVYVKENRTVCAEYGGKWKMLHYYARDFFRPTLISPYLDGTTVKLFYINDMAASLQSVHSSDLISHAPHNNNNTDKLHLSIITHTWDFNDVNVLQVSVDKVRSCNCLLARY